MLNRLAPLIFTAFLLTGCPPMDLGDTPFLCNNGDPECPIGYECRGKVCVKEGSSVAKKDAGGDGPTDALSSEGIIPGDMNMTDAEGGIPPDYGVASAKVIISEFMADPSASGDDMGEWIELYNPSSQNININGWTIKDTSGESHKLKNPGPLWVPATGYLVLGRTTNTNDNGGTPVAYAYDSVTLDNAADDLILLNEKMQVVASFSYNVNNGYQITAGSSISLKSNTADPSQASSWCVEPQTWTGSKGDRGTPLAAPKCN